MLQAFLDGALFGTTTGDGPPRAILLHGWRRTHVDFAPLGAALWERGVASVAIDLPGFGATPPPTSPSGARGYARRLAPLVAATAEAAGPVVVVGHSFGGRVGVCLAAQLPDEVGGLVLTGVPLVRSAMPAARRSRRYWVIRLGARVGVVSAARLEVARNRYGSADYRAASGTVRDVLVATIGESYEAELAAARCPIALVWGADDSTAPVGVARAAQAAAPSATLEVLEGVGHFVPTEAPETLAAAVDAMLRGGR